MWLTVLGSRRFSPWSAGSKAGTAWQKGVAGEHSMETAPERKEPGTDVDPMVTPA